MVDGGSYAEEGRKQREWGMLGLLSFNNPLGRTQGIKTTFKDTPLMM
jgi:hypothetical protein